MPSTMHGQPGWTQGKSQQGPALGALRTPFIQSRLLLSCWLPGGQSWPGVLNAAPDRRKGQPRQASRELELGGFQVAATGREVASVLDQAMIQTPNCDLEGVNLEGVN